MIAGSVAALAAGGSVAAIVLGTGRFLADRQTTPATRGPAIGPLARRPAGRRLGARLERGGAADAPTSVAAWHWPPAGTRRWSRPPSDRP